MQYDMIDVEMLVDYLRPVDAVHESDTRGEFARTVITLRGLRYHSDPCQL